MTAAEILKMIEEVSGPDRQASEIINRLDEIDLEVAVYLATKRDVREHIARLVTTTVNNFPSYTRSRDALKAIRPKGWRWNIESTDDFQCCCEATFQGPKLGGKPEVYFESFGNTEELAELHAIIQAIEYERSVLTPVP